MVDSWLKFILSAPWSASAFVLLSAVIGGAFTLGGSWIAMRKSLDEQSELQRREWQRRDTERDQERKDREQREAIERAESDREAICAVAIEALFNCIYLLGFIKVGRNLPAERRVISRVRYDASLISLVRGLDSIIVQQLTALYASATVFEFSIIQGTAGMMLQQAHLLKAQELHGRFEIMFRTIGQKVFLREGMDTLEQTLNVAKAEI
ncbi:MAG: hypothetical protein ACREQR_02000 [Candidatus Binataceae bacterium]